MNNIEPSVFAYHEAGHALTAYILNAEIISIELSKRYTHFETESNAHEKKALIFISSEVAEEMHPSYNASDTMARTMSDYLNVVREMQALGITLPKKKDEFVKKLKVQAKDIIRENLEAFLALAKEIQANDYLSGDRVITLLQKYIQ